MPITLGGIRGRAFATARLNMTFCLEQLARPGAHPDATQTPRFQLLLAPTVSRQVLKVASPNRRHFFPHLNARALLAE